MSQVLIGTSGYSFPDWVGPFYPKGTPRADMLQFYAARFPVVELNTTYYRIPAPGTLARMADRTPPGFQFVVKLHQDMTHKESTDPAVYREFRAAVQPLLAGGRLEGLLAQFPWGFRLGDRSLRHLYFLREELPEAPLFAEFRRAEWDRPECFDFLRAHGIGYCCVDEPCLPGLMPPRVAVTTDVAYLRLHGRNARDWWGSGGGDRYDYDYSEGELKEWVHKLREMAERARRTYVFFNNCHAGHAASNAVLMRELLQREGLPF